MKKSRVLIIAAVSIALASASVNAAPERSRQETVSKRGSDVMPFDLAGTMHVFTKTRTGGIQQVIARKAHDAQIPLIRTHLQEIGAAFSKGDFSGPTHVHGEEMPGLAELKNARPPELKVQYRPTKRGAELLYTTDNPELVTALHKWFDAQVSDHGHDAMEGHQHSVMHHHHH